jgi:hypothetical protein
VRSSKYRGPKYLKTRWLGIGVTPEAVNQGLIRTK